MDSSREKATKERLADSKPSEPSGPSKPDPLKETQRTINALDETPPKAIAGKGRLSPSGRGDASGKSTAPSSKEEPPENIKKVLSSVAVHPYAPTEEVPKIQIQPSTERAIKVVKNPTQTKKVFGGPSNVTLVILWTVALVSLALAIFFFATR
jgi:hypothetical protein